MTTPDLDSMARDFCRRNNFQPVSLIKAAMLEVALQITGDYNEMIKQLRRDIKADRQEAEKPQ